MVSSVFVLNQTLHASNGLCDALGSLIGNVVGVRPAVALDADKIAFAIEPMNFVATSKITKINNNQDTDPTQLGKHVLKLRAIDDRIKVTLDQSNIGRIVTG